MEVSTTIPVPILVKILSRIWIRIQPKNLFHVMFTIKVWKHAKI